MQYSYTMGLIGSRFTPEEREAEVRRIVKERQRVRCDLLHVQLERAVNWGRLIGHVPQRDRGKENELVMAAAGEITSTCVPADISQRECPYIMQWVEALSAMRDRGMPVADAGTEKAAEAFGCTRGDVGATGGA